jgi:glycosyltransferase involved in cell wall biosynthesis
MSEALLMSDGKARPGPRDGPIRVLHLRDSPWIDGPGRTILESATHVDPARVEYHIGAFTNADSSGPHPLVEAARARQLHVHAIPDLGGVGTMLVDRILEVVDRHRIQILHTHEFRSDILGLLCRRRRDLILMTTAHGWISNDWRGHVFRIANKVLLRWFDKVILVSNAMRRGLPRWWVTDRHVQVLHNALLLESYGAAVLKAERPLVNPRGKVRLLNVGRLSPEKGQELLLRVVAGMRGRYPGLELQFAGVGPLEAKLRKLAGDLGIAEHVGFLGFIRDMPAVYAETDLVVQSSFTEGLPNVILEAAYLRVPIVATDVGGTGEVIEHGQSGWLVAPRSESALEAGIEAFLKDPAGFASMADKASSRIVEGFSFQARTEKLMSLYESLLAERV